MLETCPQVAYFIQLHAETKKIGIKEIREIVIKLGENKKGVMEPAP